MKTTFDLSDALLARARRLAKRRGRPLRALVEEGLRRVLAENEDAHTSAYQLPDRSVGDPAAPNPLERFSWQDLRDAIYDAPNDS